MGQKRGYVVVGSKGQVTVFIIVGIIIVFAFAAILFFTKVFTGEQITAEADPVIAKVPQQFQPVQLFTEGCLADTGKGGLRLLGQQGGYIDPNVVGEFSSENPTEADGLEIGGAFVPYWHYNVEANDATKVVFSSLQPKLYSKDDPELSIEAQLERYVEERIDDCLNTYKAFAEQGFAITTEDPTLKDVKVTIAEETVNFLLTWDVRATLGDAEQLMEQFYVKVDLPLKRYYELAAKITEAEKNYTFLENHGLGLIHTFSGLSAEKLPPTTATEFEFAPTTIWAVGAVEQSLQRILSSYVPGLRYLGSENFYRFQYPKTELSDLYQKNYDNMILPLEDAEEMEIAFDYFNWPLYLDMNSKGAVVQPQSLTVSFSVLQFGLQQYYTVYDVSYPVLVTLEDEFKGEPYKWVFALETNIRNNQPAQDNKEAPLVRNAPAQSLVCDTRTFTDEIVKMEVVDSFTNEPVESVRIGFSVPNQADCLVGVTADDGTLESPFPKAYGGIIDLVKENYLPFYYSFDTYNIGTGNPVGNAVAVKESTPQAIEIHQFKAIPVAVKKKNLEKCIGNTCFFQGSFGNKEVYSQKPELLGSTHSWFFTPAAKALDQTEQAIIVLKRVGGDPPGIIADEYSAFITAQGAETQEVLLVPGIYEVTGTLVLEEEVVFPEEQRCKDVFGPLIEECFTLDETVMTSFLSGQIEWNTEQTYLEITPEMLYSADSLEFYIPVLNIKNVPEEPHKRVIEDMQALGALGEISRMPLVRSSLTPRFR